MKLLVTLQLNFELESDVGSEKDAVNQLVEELNKVPLIAVGATVDVVSVNKIDELN